MTKPVKVRLATLLTNPADEYGQDTEDGCRSAGLTVYPRRPRPSVGSSREMVSKGMGGYREKGLIRSSRRQIEVVDRDELRKITASDVE